MSLRDPAAEPLPLCDFLRQARARILEEWARRVRSLPSARDLSPPALIDHFGRLLEAVADYTQGLQVGEVPAPEQHTLERLAQGFSLLDLTHEYAAMRSVVLELYGQDQQGELAVDQLLRFNRALDSAITLSANRYMAARGRTLEVLERITSGALQSDDPDQLLEECLRALVETMEAVDSAVVLLVDGERLRVRAAVGLLEERDAGFSLRIGEGFAGTIAQTRAPVHLHSAATDPLVRSDFIRMRGVRALYGVPLLEGGQLLGVAHIGSKTVHEFTNEDRVVFRQVASRIAALLQEKQLRERERASLERAERAERELRRLLAENISAGEILERGDPMAVLDGAFRVTRVNTGFEALLGKRRDDALGKSFWELFPALAEPDSNAWRELHAAKEEKRPVHFEQMHAPGELWTSIAAYPTAEGGLAVFLRDISERRRSEQFQERLIGIVGHDLRNPLQAILMSARVLMQRGELSDRSVPGLLRIQRSADRMTQIINDLLDFTRARVGGGIPITRKPTDLCALAKGILEELEVTHPGQLRMECAGDVEGAWDPSRLGQVISNLLSNALTYGDRRERVRLSLEGQGDEVQLTVSNRGQPIPPELLPHIFDPFRRAGGERQEGLGLGLYIVQQIVLAHGGRIHVESEEGTTSFTVRLPRSATS